MIVSYVAFKMAALWFWTMFNCNPPVAHCYPLLWGGGILVEHWSTISSSCWCLLECVLIELVGRPYLPPIPFSTAYLISSYPSPGQNGRQFDRRLIQMSFHGWRVLYFEFHLVPNSRQAITWNNADPVHWRLYAALWGNKRGSRSMWHFSIVVLGLWYWYMPNSKQEACRPI